MNAMDKIYIELPEGARFFKSESDWQSQKQDIKIQYHNTYDSPDKYPCWGWHVSTTYNDNGPDEETWVFVYPIDDVI